MVTESTLISVREAARRLGVHENTVRRYADRGLIRAVRLPSGVRRILPEDLGFLGRDSASASGGPSASGRESPRTVDQLAAAQGVAVRSLDDLVAPEIWQSDEELAEFLTLTYAERDRDR